MGSRPSFRPVRFFIFALIVFVSLLLTITFGIFLAKDYSRYNSLQRVIIISLIVIDGITSILMYLMLAVRFSLQLDAARIVVLFAVQTTGTALFALNGSSFPCTAFGATRMCRQISFSASILSWVLCGLLVTYLSCVVILVCVPHPLPIEGLESGIDDEVPVSPQSQRAPLIHDLERQSRAAPPLPVPPATRFSEKPRQQSVLSYIPEYHPRIESIYSPHSPTSIMEVDYGPPKYVEYVDERRLLPSMNPFADPVVRVPTQSPASIYSISAPLNIANGPSVSYLPSSPRMAQFNPAQRQQMSRSRSSSFTDSIYSVMSGETRQEIPRYMPSTMGARWTVTGQRSVARSGPNSSQWKQLVLDAAAGRRQMSF